MWLHVTKYDKSTKGQNEKCKDKTWKARTTRKAIPWTAQGVLHIWRPLFQWFFADSKLTEISKNLTITIKTPSKVMLILKIWKVWLKNQARPTLSDFEPKMASNCSILQLQNFYKNLEVQENDFSWGVLFTFLLYLQAEFHFGSYDW